MKKCNYLSIILCILVLTIIISCTPKTPSTYTLKVTSSENGSVTIEPEKEIYNAGEEVILTAFPDDEYTLGEWSGDITDSNNPITITMNSNKNIKANFVSYYGWTKTFGGSSVDLCNDVFVDNSGNIFITGSFYNTVDFDFTSGTDEHTSNGENDIFITKINSDGSYGWTKTIGASSIDSGRGIVTDTTGNIYVTGDFGNTVDFDFTSGIDEHISTGTGIFGDLIDVFIMKINSDGSYGWTKTFGGSNSDYCNAISLDNSGNIFITGQFYNTVDFDFTSGVDEHTSNGNYDTFIMKITSNGSYGWTKTFGGFNNDYSNGIDIDDTGNIFVIGDFTNTVDFDFTSGIDEQSSFLTYNVFVMKINANGSYGWTKTFGGSSDDYSNGIDIDDTGNIFITGYFTNIVDFDFTSGVDEHTSNGNDDVFVMNINSDGSYGWTKTFGGLSDDRGSNIVVDNSGNIFITGYFSETVDFDFTDEIDEYISHGNFDIFVTKINNNNSYDWTKSIGGTSNDYSNDIIIDNSDDILVTGGFSDMVDFDFTSGSDEYSSSGDEDIFVFKINSH